MRSKGVSAPRAWLGLIAKNRRRYGGYIVHIGVVLVFAGVAGAMFAVERPVRLLLDQGTAVGSFGFVYRGTDLEQGPNYVATVANLTVTEGGGRPFRMRPERRFYPSGEEQTTTEVAIWSRAFEDVYAVLDRYDPASGAAELTLIVNPLMLWVWIGGAIMVLGTLIALSTPRPRVVRHVEAAQDTLAEPFAVAGVAKPQSTAAAPAPTG